DAVGHVSDLASLEALLATADRIDALVADAARRLEQEGAPAEVGAVNMTHWLRTRGGRSDRDARQIVRRSNRLGGCPTLNRDWRIGDLSTAQIETIVSAVNDRTVTVLRDQEEALASALRPLSARQSALVVRHWRAHAEAVVDGPAPDCPDRAVYLS